MSYKKATEILPGKLLKEIQKYIHGQCVYIPRKEDEKIPWGALTKSKLLTAGRNKKIFQSYEAGISVKQLSDIYFLSEKAVYKIIAQIKYQR